MEQERVVVALGGSTIAPAELDRGHLARLADAIQGWSRQHQVLVAVGGGHPARRYIEAARAMDVPETDLDRIGVAATRLNAQLLSSLLHARGIQQGSVLPTTTHEAAARAEADERIVVMGGTTPGHSTDFVAAELAHKTGAARLVIATNVDGVYTRDPRHHPDAERRESLTFDELLAITGSQEWTSAGMPGVIDGPATRLIARHGIATCIVDGTDVGNLTRAVAGEAFEGTRVAGDDAHARDAPTGRAAETPGTRGGAP